MRTWKAIATAVFVLAASDAAQAQTRYDWTGIYGGGNIGWSANQVDWTYFNNPTQSVHRDFNAFTYGLQAGGQVQWGQLVLGLEFGASGSKDSGTGVDAPAFANNFDTKATVTSIITAGPRIGYAYNNWLFYGTGGYALTTTKSEFYVRATPAVNDIRSGTSEGWFAGGGIEHALTKNLILGIEYRHIEANRILVGPAIPVTNVSRYVDTSVDEVKARLSFKIGP